MMCKGNVGLMFYGAGMIVADQTELHLFIVVQFPSAFDKYEQGEGGHVVKI